VDLSALVAGLIVGLLLLVVVVGRSAAHNIDLGRRRKCLVGELVEVLEVL